MAAGVFTSQGCIGAAGRPMLMVRAASTVKVAGPAVTAGLPFVPAGNTTVNPVMGSTIGESTAIKVSMKEPVPLSMPEL
jgi:hypothetical protein